MKIAFLVGYFPSLSETFILNQITGLLDRGHNIEIYAHKPNSSLNMHPEVEKYDLIKSTHYYPDIPKNYLFRLLKVLSLLSTNFLKSPAIVLKSLNIFKYGKMSVSLRLLYFTIPFLDQDTQYDIIHCHFGMNGVIGMMLRDLGVIKGKLCTVFHAFDLSAHLQVSGVDAYKLLFQKGDLFLPISEYWRNRLIELGCDPKKICVHHMGISTSKFKFIPRQLYNDGVIRLITVARLVEKKGLEYAIRALAKLKQSYPNIEYQIIGDGPLLSSLENLVIELNLTQIVIFKRWRQVDEVVEILDHSSIFILPSVTSVDGDQEGIPLALMEGMAMGLPVISTYHSGIPELIQDKISGFLLDERDIDGIAETIIYCIEHPELWKSMGQEGRRIVEKSFDSYHLNNRLVDIFEILQHKIQI